MVDGRDPMDDVRRSGTCPFWLRHACAVLVVAVLTALTIPVAHAQTASPPSVAAPQTAPVSPATPPPADLPPASRSLDATLPAAHDLSPWAMFMGADIVVKAVILGLAFASLVTWTVLIAKSLEILVAKRRVRRALTELAGCRTLAEAEAAFPKSRREVVSGLVGEASAEERLSQDGGGGVLDRAGARCAEVIRAEGRSIRVGMGLLATIGSTSPFVGLFGTVWGIMNSFVGIARTQTTNLAVVAPGIAEALLATAIGLVAAIPAVIIYNHFSRETRDYLELVGRASGTVVRLLSRDLDRSVRPAYRAAAE